MIIHTTLTTHSIEGIVVMVIIFVLGTGLCVCYYLWHRAEAKLKSYHQSEEDKRITKKMNPTADTKPIIFGHIDPSSNAGEKAAPIIAPPTRLRRIPLNIFDIAKRRLSKDRTGVNQKRGEPKNGGS